MAITINGTGTITGISVGGLNDGIITQPEIATGVAGTGPAFSAYASGNQSLTTGTFTKLSFQTEEFDTANCYDNATNYRFTPNVAGYYQFVCCMNLNANAGVTLMSFYKNGSEFKRGSQLAFSASGSTLQPNSTALIYLNGSTDYVECYGYQSSGGTVSTSANSVQVYFQASMIRSA